MSQEGKVIKRPPAFEVFACPRCSNDYGFTKAGSILSPRGRIQRYKCGRCGKKFHQSLKERPLEIKQGYLDIETSNLIASFGHIYSWALKPRGKVVVYHDVLKTRSLAEERRIIKSLIIKLKDFDQVITYYGSRFDIPFLRTRCLCHKLDFPEYMALFHVDLYYVARNRLKMHSNRLDAVAKFLNVEDKKTPLEPQVWVDASFGSKKALRYILEHNIQDVKVLEQVHIKLETYFRGTNQSI